MLCLRRFGMSSPKTRARIRSTASAVGTDRERRRAGASVDANHRLVAAASISLIGARFLFSIIVLTSLRIDIEGPIRTVPARL